ncbi:MAG: hypothetical protein ACI915_002961 [Gammaproteobacteria bacterium]|jgi:hypothetical protein
MESTSDIHAFAQGQDVNFDENRYLSITGE